MIKLFITDLDGCISTPFKTPDWETITAIRQLNQQSKERATIPPLSICSGRPFAYVEAVAQWLDITQPVVFENAGIFNMEQYAVATNNAFDEEAAEQVEAIQAWFKEAIIPNYEGMMVEFSKFMDAGLIHPDRAVIDEVYEKVRTHVANRYGRFEVYYTDVSVNVVVKANNKRTGIQDLCDRLGIDVSEAAYIGDSSGDVPGLELVGMPFAPANGSDAVKAVGKEAPHSVTKAVLWAYEQIIAHNSAG